MTSHITVPPRANKASSNRLPILQAQIQAAHLDVQQHEAAAASKALSTGEMLVEAKGLCRHGDWLSFLKAVGIPEGRAQRYMLLHRAGFKSDTVSYLGWATAERYASIGMTLFPQPGHIILGSGRKADLQTFLYWSWRHTAELGGYGFITAGSAAGIAQLTDRRPTHIWGLGCIHDALTADASFITEPDESPYIDDPKNLTQMLIKFTSMETWP